MLQESLHINMLEHEVLAPRTREQWDHNPFFCDVCWPELFLELRSGGIYGDTFMRNHPLTQERLAQLREESIVDLRPRVL